MKTVDGLVSKTFGLLAGGMLAAGAAALVTSGLLDAGLVLTNVGTELCMLGVCYGLIALIFACLHRRYVRRVEELSRFGLRVRGCVTALHTDWLVRLGRERPVFAAVECTLPDGRTIILRSHRVWRRNVQTGMPADVLIDPQDERQAAILFEVQGRPVS